MEGIKKIVNVLVMIYLVVAAFIYAGILNVGQETNPGFYTTFFIIGGILMLLELIVENLFIANLKKGQVQAQHKVNEIKATLYDLQQELQETKKKHADELAAAKSDRPTTYAVTPEPAIGAIGTPTGTDPTPIITNTPTENKTVIITHGPTPGTPSSEQQQPGNTDS